MANSKSNVSEKNCFDIPVWRRYTLTIEEAAGYYHIGEGKLRMLIDQNPHEDFYVMNGNRALIKREKFERYLDRPPQYKFRKNNTAELPFSNDTTILRARFVIQCYHKSGSPYLKGEIP